MIQQLCLEATAFFNYSIYLKNACNMSTPKNIWTTQSFCTKTKSETVWLTSGVVRFRSGPGCDMLRHGAMVSRVDFWPGSERWSRALPSQCLWSRSRLWKQRTHRKDSADQIVKVIPSQKKKVVHLWRYQDWLQDVARILFASGNKNTLQCSVGHAPPKDPHLHFASMTGLKAFHVAISHSAEDVFGLFGHGARSLHQ